LEGGANYRFAVRAASVEGVEEDGRQYVEVTTDAGAPEQPEELTGGVTH